MFSRLAQVGVLSASLLAGSVAPICADAPSPAFLQRVDELVRWMAQRSDYPAALAKPPAFRFLAPAAIRHAFGNTMMGYSQDKDVTAAQVGGTIILPDSFTLGHDDYMLLHELVHYLQEQTGKKFACMKEREREAYQLQIEFVAETGVGQVPNDIYMLMLRCDVRE